MGLGLSIDRLEEKVVHWAEDRNITTLGGSSSLAQLSKTLEECAELLEALTADKAYDTEKEMLYKSYDEIDADLRQVREAIKDAYGDILVTLIIGMTLSGLTTRECLAHAYDQIKDRKGRMENGVFVKEG